MSPCLLPLMLIVPFPQEPGIAPEIVVTPTRGPALAQESARHVTVVTAEEIASKGYRSVPDALRGEAGVLVQQTNLGGGSPFIRGLTGNQILLMVDGVRLNNAGTPLDVRVAESSGHDLLDRAARATVAEWRFRPA